MNTISLQCHSIKGGGKKLKNMKVLSHEVFICNFTPIAKRITYSIWRQPESGIYVSYKHDADTQVQSESLQFIKMLLCN